ncbi:MAG: DUF438 domain-containing protein [Anaerolineales bacterium]|nr:DUF438 domain-containing protein [Anaerolineales bacterium]
MSEVINNRQERIDIMKSLIRRLHEGSEEKKIRRQLETMLDEADYSDVFLMEVQLIEEGIDQESIQELCDTHTRVLSGHLDLQETPETNPGHPVHTFLQENKELNLRVQKARLVMEEVQKLEEGADALPLMRDIQGFLNELMDVDKHYRRKENLLFPFFEKKDIPGPPAVMWGKHDEVRENLRLTIQGLQEIDRVKAGEARAYNFFAVQTALESVEDMIYKEEKILFPTSLDILSDQEWYQIYQESPEIGFCLYDPEFDWAPEGVEEFKESFSSTSSGRLQMPTGAFQLEELIAVFSTLPFDITFVDQEDTVRYFSPGKDRIFDRSRAILGRKVQYCHPPKSVHTVNQILKDFKSGAQDRARFWIQMGPRKIYIVYYALRDEEDTYLGTLEVTQDITEIQALEGERRLLEYEAEEPQASHGGS